MRLRDGRCARPLFADGRQPRRLALVLVLVLAPLVTVAGAAAGPAAVQPTLAVVVIGSGHVVGSPAGISCPGRCRATYAAGAVVTLTAAPAKGSSFLRWGGSCRGAAVCRVRVAGLAAVAAQFTAVAKPKGGPSVVQPGSYTGSNGQNGNGVTFYVPPSRAGVLNVLDTAVALSCTSTGGSSDHLGILKIAIRPNGSFAAKTTQKGTLGGAAATFTYRFSGRFQAATATRPASAAGTWREDIATAGSRCTSNNQPWSATRNALPSPTRSPVKAGSYSGQNGQNGNGLTFSVSPDRRSILNVLDTAVALACRPSSGTSDHLGIAKAAIRPDGSFGVRASQKGISGGRSATFTYTFSGYFEGPTPLGPVTAAGIYREDIAYAGGGVESCTSNDQS